MRGRRALAVLGRVAAGIGISAFAAWIAFVPAPQEPGYELVRVWGVPGSGPGQFRDPTGIAVVDGEVFVADFYNHRIQKFSADGTFRTAFGRPGSGPGELRHPVGVAVGPEGDVFVADFGNQRVQRWRSPDR